MSTTVRSGALVGPWDDAFWFEVPFALRSKSNFRRTPTNKRSGWSELAAFEASLVPLARLALPQGWELGAPPPSPVATRPVVVAFMMARTTLDAANLSKSVLDALEGVVFHTDASVRCVSCLSERAASAQHGLVAFARLAPSSGLTEIHAASAALGSTTITHWD